MRWRFQSYQRDGTVSIQGTLDARQQRAEEYSRQHITACCCNGMGYIHLNVQPGHPLFGVAIPCVCLRDARARERAEQLRSMCGLSERAMADMTFASFAPSTARDALGNALDAQAVRQLEAMRAYCLRYAAKPEGWLILVGPIGSGKTHLAAAIAVECMAHGMAVHMATMPDLLDMLRQGYAEDADARFEERFDWLRNVGLLILDDLGTEHATPWAAEKLYQIVNYRYERRLPMVVTSNVNPHSLSAQAVDARVLSRLLEGTEAEGGWSRVLTLPCGDYRRRKAKTS